MPLFLTYNINFEKDGLGAQYSRVIDIYCLAKFIGAKYVHTPILVVDHLNNEYSKEVNNHFGLSIFERGTNGIPETYDEEIEIKILSNLEQLNVHINEKNVLIKIGLAMYVLAELQERSTIYDEGMKDLRLLKKKLELPEFEKDKTNVAIHIRRGDINEKSGDERFTNDEHYIKIINVINKKYNNANICIFTEKEGINIDVFLTSPNVKILHDIDVLQTFEYFCNADVLIVAKSTFSYLPALYNTSNEIYIPYQQAKFKLSRF